VSAENDSQKKEEPNVYAQARAKNDIKQAGVASENAGNIQRFERQVPRTANRTTVVWKSPLATMLPTAKDVVFNNHRESKGPPTRTKRRRRIRNTRLRTKK
jgi:hypothetical protein